VIGLAIAANLISIIPILGFFLIFLMPFMMMIYVAIYENAIGNALTTTKEA